MTLSKYILNSVIICAIVVLPHLGLIPNFGYCIPILLLVWYTLRSHGETFSDIGFDLKSFRPKYVLIGGLVAIIALGFMQLIFFPLLELMVSFEDGDAGLYDFLKENRWQYMFLVIMGWIVGGVYEEIVFHGFMFTRMEKMIQGKFSTILSFVITSVLFGVYHYQLGSAGLINAFILGMVYLSLFLFFKRNLWSAIFCHGIYNTVVMTLIYFNYL